MIRILRWSAAVVAALALFVVAVHLVSRAMGPSEAERQALLLVDAPPQLPPGRDGFAALYTLRHDVPQAEQARVLAEDVRRFAATSPLALGETGDAPAWHSVLDDWPQLPAGLPDEPRWCPLREAGCVDRVRAAPGAYASLVARNATLLDRTAALAGYDYFHNPFAARLDMPIPAYQPLTWLPTRHAWRFVNGQVDEALAGACGDVALGRRVIEASDSLITSMISAALVRGNATLLADMLAELPRDHPLPAQCSQAFGHPLAVDRAMCGAMLGEGRFSMAGLRTQIAGQIAAGTSGYDGPAWAHRLLFDPERTAARWAPTFAWYCGDQARELIVADRPLVDATPPPSRWSLACASNAVGCILADIDRPAYRDYGRRLQDADARLRAMAALLWLRKQEGAIDEAALARLPESMRSPARPLRLDLSAATLGTALYAQSRPDRDHDGTWTVPLPASRLQSAGASP